MQINHLNYLHFKNFLARDDFIKIANYVESQDFDWYWRDTATSFDTAHNFIHMLYRTTLKEDGTAQIFKTSHWNFFEDFLMSILKAFNGKYICHAKFVLHSQRTQVSYTAPHYDLVDINREPISEAPIRILIMNFTTCNGGTQIGGIDVPSVANTAVLFDNKVSHCGIMQSDKPRRVLLNFCFEEND